MNEQTENAKDLLLTEIVNAKDLRERNVAVHNYKTFLEAVHIDKSLNT